MIAFATPKIVQAINDKHETIKDKKIAGSLCVFGLPFRSGGLNERINIKRVAEKS